MKRIILTTLMATLATACPLSAAVTPIIPHGSVEKPTLIVPTTKATDLNVPALTIQPTPILPLNVDFRGQNINNKNLINITAPRARLDNMSFQATKFDHAGMAEAQMPNTIQHNISYIGTSLQQSNWQGAVTFDSNFSNANLTGSNFKGAQFNNCNFQNTILQNINYDQNTKINGMSFEQFLTTQKPKA